MVELNEQQKEAVELIKIWFESSDELIFTLSGSAGTGKTFLINYIIKNVISLRDDQVAFIAYTGKAASVIAQRTGKETSTIHRLIYNPVEVMKKVNVGGVEKEVKKIQFMRKPTIGPYKLIVLDEISMVDETILEDLKSYKIKILCCGDIAQLPAIMKSNTLLDSPDYSLTKIMRQKGDSIILKLAQMAKEGVEIPYGNYGDAVVLRDGSIPEDELKDILLNSDQIICGTNKTRNALNTYIRSLKGIDTARYRFPLSGEKIICTMNNYEIFLDAEKKYNLVNGTIGTCIGDMETQEDDLGVVSFEPDFLSETTHDILVDTGIFSEGEFKHEPGERAWEFYNGTYGIRNINLGKNISDDERREKVSQLIHDKMDAVDDVAINHFEFAYAISCHKSQGSEWDNIVIFDESKIFRDNSKKWLYTAITRARKKIILIR